MTVEGRRQVRGAESCLVLSACVGAAVISALVCNDVMHSLRLAHAYRRTKQTSLAYST
jgi:hypothetical protein